MLNFNSKNKEHSPNVDLLSKDLKNGRGRFIVDTGAEMNLIKRKRIKTGVPVNSQVRYHLFGINEKGVELPHLI